VRARQDIDMALRLAPSDVKTRVVLARWQLASGDLRGAETTLRNALAAHPRDPDALFVLSKLYFWMEAKKPEASRKLETVEPWIARLEAVATGALQLNEVAWYWARRNDPERGLALARRSVEADSSCAYCFDTLALLLFQSGRVASAVQMQRAAINLLESKVPAEMQQRLEQFENALAELNRAYVDTGSKDVRARFPDVRALDERCAPALPLTVTKLEYPAAARMNEIEGVVQLEFVVREDGRVTDVTPIRGPLLLVEAAVRAVQSWSFSPAQCDGRAVASVRKARLPFVLKNAAH